MTPDLGSEARSFFVFPERQRRIVIERLSTYLWISVGAVLGANLRFLTNRALAQWLGAGFPYGTFVVNIAGSVAIGLVGALIAANLFDRPELVRQVVIIGFLGSLTTFSSFTYETHNLLQDGEWMRASANILLSVFAGLVGVRAGIYLAARIGGSL